MIRKLLFCISVFALIGCHDTSTAIVSDAHGLAAGAPVQASGVRVGQVDSVQLVSEGARITFSVEGDAIADDAVVCASADPSGLELRTGEELGAPLSGESPLPECPASAEESIREGIGVLQEILGAGDAIGDAVRDGVRENVREAAREAGAALRESAQGFVEGATAGEIRETGRDIGRATMDFADGLAEGAMEGSQAAP